MNRFKVNKIGLLNFWLYDEEEYDFYGGNLILRGTNGSGKSVTMQSFIPLILDGNKSPDRLDPFGSKERKIEDYIIGDRDSIQKEEAISYLYMEVHNKEKNNYITVGLGFRGKKGRPVESWGFALKDGKRIGKDFYLYKDPVNKIPLTKNELKSRLGTINEFTETIKDYKEMVNRLLFGFPNLDMYDEFIKLLLQLRSNKLSKDYKPTNLIGVLNTVLQPLSEDDLKPLSEAVEQMNKTKEQIEILEKNHKSLKDFLKVYKNYNEIILLTKARNYKNVSDEYKKLENNISASSHTLNNLKDTLGDKKNRFNKVTEELEINKEKKRQLDNLDLKQKIEDLSNIEENIKTLEEKVKELEENIDKRNQEEIDLNIKNSKVEDEIYKLKKELTETIIDLKDLSNDSYFDEIVFFADETQEKLEENISFESVLMSLKNYKVKVNKVINYLEEEKKILSESENTKLEFEKLVRSYKDLEKDIRTEEQNLKESIMTWEEEFINNLNNNSYLKLNDEIKKDIFNLMNEYKKENYDKVRKIYEDFARDTVNDITKIKLSLENKIEIKQKDIIDIDNNLEEIKNTKDISIPSLNIETDKILKENNIDNIALYKCIEFKDNIDDKVKDKIEATLLDLNILNAKIINEKDIDKVINLKSQILYLKKSTKKKDNISKYFDIKIDKNETNIKENYVKEILESISINPKDTFSITEKGTAHIDILNSVADASYKQTFIGYLKRLELKNKKIKELEEQKELVTKEINNLNNMVSENNNKISTIEKEMNNLPTNENINNILDKIKELNISLEWNDKKQKEIEEELSKFDLRLKEVREEINLNKKGIFIPLNLESYKKANIVIESIQEILQNLKTTHTAYLAKIEMNKNYKERLSDIISNADYLKSLKEEKNQELQINIQNEKTINELLNTKEYKDQKEKLLKTEQTIRNLTSEKEELIKSITKTETDINYKDEELNKLTTNKDNKEEELNVYKEIFTREYNLKYIYDEDIVDIDKTVKIVIKDGKNRKEVSLADSLNRFFESYNHYSLELNDYSLRTTTLFNDYENIDEKFKNIYESNTRADVTSMYQGIKLNIIELFKKLEMILKKISI